MYYGNKVCMHVCVYAYIHMFINARHGYICDWLWENLPVTHKDNYLKINSKRNISRRPKAAGLQFATYVAIALQGL